MLTYYVSLGILFSGILYTARQLVLLLLPTSGKTLPFWFLLHLLNYSLEKSHKSKNKAEE